MKRKFSEPEREFYLRRKLENERKERQAYLYARYENGPELSESEMDELRDLINRPYVEN